MKVIKSRPIWLIIVLFLVLCTGIVIITLNHQNKPLQKVKVRLSWVDNAQFAGFYYAKDKGIYKKYGLDVELLPADPKISQSAEIADDKVNFSIMSSNELIAGYSKGYKIKGVGVIFQLNPHCLATLKTSNINSPKDFLNKSLGIAGNNDEGKILYSTLLNLYGIPEKNVSFKVLGFDSSADIEQKNADVVDIYRIDQTYLLDKQNTKYSLILPENYGFETHGDVIVTSTKYLADNEKITRKFVKATLEGWDSAFKDEETAIKLSYKYAKNEYKDLEFQRHIFNSEKALVYGTASKLGDFNPEFMNNTYLALRAYGTVKTNYDPNVIYTNTFVND